MSELEFEIVVIGAGPAGLAAACAAANTCRRVGLIEESPWIGGQIWRGQSAKPTSGIAQAWLDRFQASGAVLLDNTCVVGAAADRVLLAERQGEPTRFRAERIILATGARELFLPFPGWTLPGVMGAGGLLGLAKNGWPVRDQRILVAGTGPLLFAAAQGLLKQGAKVVGIIEQAPWSKVARFAGSLWKFPGKLWQGLELKVGLRGVPFSYGAWPVSAEGDGRVQRVTWANGKTTRSADCDLLACGFGLLPNIELPLELGCLVKGGFVQVDQWQTTSLPHIFCAGEPTGIGGADCALIEGQIAGYAATGQQARAETLFGKRASWHRFRDVLARSFSLRSELKRLANPATVVCRCEDVRHGQLREFTTWREAKLHSRCGMGPCQGRVCGPATKFLYGWGMESVRLPIFPARATSLLSAPDQH